MASVDIIQNVIIDKIHTIKNIDFLVALDNLISENMDKSEIIELTHEQKVMLDMSELDIKNGDLISQEAMINRNLEWLNSI